MHFVDWINEKPSCGMMHQSAGLVQGGNFSTRVQFPWIASIMLETYRRYEHKGSGTSKHILSTASSVANVDPQSKRLTQKSFGNLKILLGTIEYGSAGISKIVIHLNARSDRPNIADLVVIFLLMEIPSSNFISPICLWTSGGDLQVDRVAYSVGCANSEIRKHVAVTVKDRTLS